MDFVPRLRFHPKPSHHIYVNITKSQKYLRSETFLVPCILDKGHTNCPTLSILMLRDIYWFCSRFWELSSSSMNIFLVCSTLASLSAHARQNWSWGYVLGHSLTLQFLFLIDSSIFYFLGENQLLSICVTISSLVTFMASFDK